MRIGRKEKTFETVGISEMPFGNFTDLHQTAQCLGGIGSSKGLEQVAQVARSRGSEEMSLLADACIRAAGNIREERLTRRNNG